MGSRTANSFLGSLPPEQSVLVYYVGSAYRNPGELPVAHRAVHEPLMSVVAVAHPACGVPGPLLWVEAQDAAYFSVPCRDSSCFPE